MAFREQKILPAFHAQQDPANHRDVLNVLGIDRDFGDRTCGQVEARHIVVQIDSHRNTTGWAESLRYQCPAGLNRAPVDNRQDGCDLARKHTSRNCREYGFGLRTDFQSEERVLQE